MPRKKQTPYERLWKHIVKSDDINECWTWKGGKNNVGYPMIKSEHPKKMMLAHRVMGEHMGLVGPEIQRTCDSYECLNPNHLISGNKSERMMKVHSNPDYKRKQLKNTFVNCPVCDKRAWYPTLKRYHKDCFACEKA